MNTSRLLPFVLSSMLVACVAPADREPLASTDQPIIGGAVDTGDPAVVMIIALAANKYDGAICTGTVVSPHVIATAAHCVDPDVLVPLIGAGYTLNVFLGDNNNDPTQYNDVTKFVDIAQTSFNSAYDPNAKPPVHDSGVVVTKTALTITPIALNRTPLGADWVGAPARVIGYGQSVAGDDNSSAQKKQATLTISGIDAEQLRFGSDEPNLCEGDSGGPTLIKRGDVESLAGVHSYGDSTKCAGNSFDMRVDVDFLGLLDPLIAANDPDFAPPSDGATPGSGGAGGSGGSPSGTTSTSSGGSTKSQDDGGCSIVSGVGASRSSAAFPFALMALGLLRFRSRRSSSRARGHAHL